MTEPLARLPLARLPLACLPLARLPIAPLAASTPDAAPLLTRRLLEAGAIDAIATKDAPGIRLRSAAECLASLRETLAVRPAGDVWVFGYGSLIWNPAIVAVQRRVARVDGWSRSFCLSITALRATAERPGLMLALERGGSCWGVAYRLAEADVERELRLLWHREMACGAYVPRWVEILDEHGARCGHAITFTADPAHPRHVGGLDEAIVALRLARATGGLGSCADYLFRTCDALCASGIEDPAMQRLATLVRRLQRDIEQPMAA